MISKDRANGGSPAFEKIAIASPMLIFTIGDEDTEVALVSEQDYSMNLRSSFQGSASTLDICRARSKMVRCSSDPSTSLLSTSEKIITILAFCLSGMVSLKTIS